MAPNAYILDWTMNEYEVLKLNIEKNDFNYQKEEKTNHIRVFVPFDRVDDFMSIVQTHLNKPYNYVDIQFPEQKTTVVLFVDECFFIQDAEMNKKVKTWAIEKGLPVEQADWSCSFVER